jgi:enediyne biosynthesis protein E4
VAVCDYDADGWPDLFVSNDTEPSLVYHNQGDGTFQEVATELGVAVAESGKPKAGMGIDTGDDRNDGNESILMTNFAGEQISLYRKDSTGLYLDNAAAAGVGLPSQLFLGFGGLFFDVDLDGWLDIFVTDGHVMDDIEQRNTGVSYAQPALLFHNDGHGQYTDITRSTGTALPVPEVGRGAASGDADNDGDLDLLLTTNGGPARLLRNDSRRENGWLKLQLRGGPSNRDAIGARVQVRVGGLTMTRMVKSGSSYLSASDRRLTFGLGRAPGADSVTIQWPTGAVQSLGPVERNRWLRITEGRSGTGAQVR